MFSTAPCGVQFDTSCANVHVLCDEVMRHAFTQTLGGNAAPCGVPAAWRLLLSISKLMHSSWGLWQQDSSVLALHVVCANTFVCSKSLTVQVHLVELALLLAAVIFQQWKQQQGC